MGLETVKEEIIREAKEQASALIAEARKESSRLMKEAENKLDEMKKKSDAETQKTLEHLKRQELASAELESKKIILEVKKQLIEDVFAEAKKKLENLEEKKREAYISKLFDKTKADIEIGAIYCNKKDSKFVKVKTEDAEIIGGLIAENKDRTVRVDYSFETLIQSIKDNELQNISKILFG